jgi:hypothetical protein
MIADPSIHGRYVRKLLGSETASYSLRLNGDFWSVSGDCLLVIQGNEQYASKLNVVRKLIVSKNGIL